MSRRMRMDPVQMQTWNALISNPSPRQIFDQRRCAGCHHILFLWWKLNELSRKVKKMVFTPSQCQKVRFCDPSFAIFPIFSWPDRERKWAIKSLSQCDRSQYIAIEQIGAMGLNKKVKSLEETLSWFFLSFNWLDRSPCSTSSKLFQNTWKIFLELYSWTSTSCSIFVSAVGHRIKWQGLKYQESSHEPKYE